jgi:hypothetical protein
MLCLDCRAPTRPFPGALYCEDCHAARLAANEIERNSAAGRAMRRNDDRAWQKAGLPPRPWPPAETDWTTGRPNVTCPACGGRYHYGAPGAFTHLCPLCDVWLKWVETGETITRRREVRVCPACGGPVVKRAGKYGEFYGCANYPNCKGIAKAVRIEEYEAPRLALARWTPYAWTEMDERAKEAAERAERIEGFDLWIKSLKWRPGK